MSSVVPALPGPFQIVISCPWHCKVLLPVSPQSLLLFKPGATLTSLLSLRLTLCPSTPWPYKLSPSPGKLSAFSTHAFHTQSSSHNLDYNFSNQIPGNTFLVGTVQVSLEFWGCGQPPASARQLEERCVPFLHPALLHHCALCTEDRSQPWAGTQEDRKGTPVWHPHQRL